MTVVESVVRAAALVMTLSVDRWLASSVDTHLNCILYITFPIHGNIQHRLNTDAFLTCGFRVRDKLRSVSLDDDSGSIATGLI